MLAVCAIPLGLTVRSTNACFRGGSAQKKCNIYSNFIVCLRIRRPPISTKLLALNLRNRNLFLVVKLSLKCCCHLNHREPISVRITLGHWGSKFPGWTEGNQIWETLMMHSRFWIKSIHTRVYLPAPTMARVRQLRGAICWQRERLQADLANVEATGNRYDVCWCVERNIWFFFECES